MHCRVHEVYIRSKIVIDKCFYTGIINYLTQNSIELGSKSGQFNKVDGVTKKNRSDLTMKF